MYALFSQRPSYRLLLALAFLVLGGGIWLYIDQGTELEEPRWQIKGQTMGSISYHLQYRSPLKRLSEVEIDSLLSAFNNVFSTYVPHSELSMLNRCDSLLFSSHLWPQLFEESQRVYLETRGAFDPTLGPLIEAWGFGARGRPSADTSRIKELLQYVGFDKVHISGQVIRKEHARVALDLSGIAKGYAVDVLADYLMERELHHYMIEIGGEIRVSGERSTGKAWRIGIQDPLSPQSQQPAALLKLRQGGLATSGNYRNYRQVGHQSYGHTIDPRTGRPHRNELLSVTIWAERASRADALATACLVMGLSEAKELISATDQVEALFFYTPSPTLTKDVPKALSYISEGLRSYVSDLRYGVK